jgi:putative RNA 2'-phosphotransferase
MEEKTQKKISKFLSFVLRHQPEYIGISLDKNGWADVADLIANFSNFTPSMIFFTSFSLKNSTLKKKMAYL